MSNPTCFSIVPSNGQLHRQCSSQESNLENCLLRLTTFTETLGSIPQPTHLEVAGLLVILDQIVLIQHQSSSMNQIQAALVQQGISLEVIVRNAIEGWGSEHSDIEVGIAKPVHCILQEITPYFQHGELMSK